MRGATSGYAGFKSPAVGPSITWTLPTVDGSAGQMLKTDGAGNLSWASASASAITSINGSSVTAQTFPTPGTSGTAPSWSTNTGTGAHTLNIPMASTASVTAGLISKTDYDAFNNKLSTTSVHAGDVSGPYSSTTVDKIKGTALTVSSLSNGNFLKYNGSAWVNTSLSASDITTALSYTPVNRAGDTMSGALNFNGNAATNLLSESFKGSTSGTLTITVPATVTSYTMKWPSTVAASNGQVLTSDTSGNLSWATVASASNTFVNGGNSFGGNATLGTNDAYTLALKTNNTARMTIGSTGNIGIGIASAVTPLQVFNTSGGFDSDMRLGGQELQLAGYSVTNAYAEERVAFYKSRGTYSSQTAVQNADVLSSIFSSGYDGSSSIQSTVIRSWVDGPVSTGTVPSRIEFGTFDTSLQTRMTIKSDGKVGIGTSTPSSLLQISGTDNTGLFNITNTGTSGSTLQTQMSFSGYNGTSVSKMGLISTTGSTFSYGTFQPKQFVIAAQAGATNGLNLRTATADITFSTGNADPDLSSERMRIMSSGNVGIGTNNPGAPLDVKGEIRMSGATSGYVGFKSPATGPSVTWTLPTADGSAGQFLKTDGSGNLSWGSASGGGITSINGSSVASQTFPTPGTSGTAPSWSTNTGTGAHTLNIPMASTASVTAGLLSKTDYDIFSNKLGTTTVHAGDISGPYNAVTVDKIKGTALVISSLASGNYLKYNGTTWVNSMIDAGDIATGTLSVARGGTGASSLGSGNLLIGGGTGAVTSLAAGTIGNVVFATGATTWASGTADTANLVDKSSIQTISGAKAFGNNIQMNSQNAVRFADSDSSNYVAFAAPATIGTNVTWTLPAIDGSSGQVLSTNGAGVLSWVSASGSGFVNNGNSFGGAATLGTNDANSLAFETNNTTRMTISSTGFVGIGTAPSAYKLDVNGDILSRGGSNNIILSDGWVYGQGFSNLSTGSNSTIATSATGTQITRNVADANPALVVQQMHASSTGDVLQVKNNSSTLMAVQKGGNVGIGVTSPGSKLDVAGDIYASGNITTNNTLFAKYSLYFTAQDQGIYWPGTTAQIYATGGTSNHLGFGTLGTERLRITSAGKIGIGTDTPWAKMDIYDENKLVNFRVMNGDSSTPQYPTIMVANYLGTAGSGSAKVDISNARGNSSVPAAVALGDVLGDLSFSGAYDGLYNTTSGAIIRSVATQNFSSTAAGSDLRFLTTINGAFGATERMRIDSAGNVGIGVSAPAQKLHVDGNIAVNNNQGYVFYDNTGTNTAGGYFNITNANNVQFQNLSSGGSMQFSVLNNSGTLQFFTGASGTERMRITNSGRVGIGTSAPGYNLHVVGTAGLSTGTAWTNASDIRLKNIDGDYEYGLDEILKLHTVRFHYKPGNALNIPSEHPMTGFVAQEVQKVIPDAVHVREDGYLELNVDPIHWATVNAVQELHGMCKMTDAQVQKNTKDIEKLNRALASVQSENEKLKKDNERIKNENAQIKKDLEAIKKKLGL